MKRVASSTFPDDVSDTRKRARLSASETPFQRIRAICLDKVVVAEGDDHTKFTLYQHARLRRSVFQNILAHCPSSTDDKDFIVQGDVKGRMTVTVVQKDDTRLMTAKQVKTSKRIQSLEQYPPILKQLTNVDARNNSHITRIMCDVLNAFAGTETPIFKHDGGFLYITVPIKRAFIFSEIGDFLKSTKYDFEIFATHSGELMLGLDVQLLAG